MAVLKYKDPATGTWMVLPSVGPAGPQGPPGPYNDNMFPNADWESWDGSGNPVGWSGFWRSPNSGPLQPLLGPISVDGMYYQGTTGANVFIPAQGGTDAVIRLWPVSAIACQSGGNYFSSAYIRSNVAGAGGIEFFVITAPPGVDPQFFVSGIHTIQTGRINLTTSWTRYEFTWQVPSTDVSMRCGWCPGTRGDHTDSALDNNVFADTMILKRIDPYGAPALAGNGTALTAARSDHFHTSSAYGKVAYAFYGPSTDPSTVFTTVMDTGLSCTWTADPSRMYKTTVCGFSSQVTNVASQVLTICDASNNVIKQMNQTAQVTAGYQPWNVVMYESGLSGSITRKARIASSAASGNFRAQTTYPWQMVVEDVGAA